MSQKILTFCLLFVVHFSFSQLYINEIDADTPGSDQLEFIEIKSVNPNFPLDGYVLVFIMKQIYQVILPLI